MASYAWVAHLNPGCEEEYRRRHEQIWAEMVETLKAAGMLKYAIFRNGLELFGYFETDDIDLLRSELAASAVRARWSASLSHLMTARIDPSTKFPRLLPLVWELG